MQHGKITQQSTYDLAKRGEEILEPDLQDQYSKSICSDIEKSDLVSPQNSYGMTLSELWDLVRWDLRFNGGYAFEQLRAKALLIEVRLEQFVYQNTAGRNNPLAKLLWILCRTIGSVYQWFFFNSIIPGSVQIGRGLRLPHPQNIIIAYRSRIGDFCIIYHNVSIVWNGFIKTKPNRPEVGDRVLIGNGAILVGDVTIGDNVLIGAGAVVPKSVPPDSRVLAQSPRIDPRPPSEHAAKAGSDEHMKDFYAIWR